MSSPVIANCVFATISLTALRGSVALGVPPDSGSVGKSSRGSVCMRESNRSAATFTPPLSSAMRMSVSGSDLHDLVKLLRRQRQRSGLWRPSPAHLLRSADFEIGGKKAHLVALRFHQHVGQNRNRVLAFDDSLKKLQFSQKVVLADDKFHGCADLEKGGGSGARDPLRRGEIRE